jgi:uncharacterized protein (TIGR00369 family)
MPFVPSNPDFATRVHDSFARMAAMRLIGAHIGELEPGRCTVELPARADLTQQHGFVHGGVLAMIADTAGGYAAFTLMPADASVLTVEFKVNLLAPARGDHVQAAATVLKAGRTLSIVRADVFAHDQGRTTLVATMQQTVMAMHGRKDE